MSLLKRAEKKKKLLEEIKDLTEEITILKDPKKAKELEDENKEIKELEELKIKAQAQADKLKNDLENKDVSTKSKEEEKAEVEKAKKLLTDLLK